MHDHLHGPCGERENIACGPGLERLPGETDAQFIERLQSEVSRLQLVYHLLRDDICNIGELVRRAVAGVREPPVGFCDGAPHYPTKAVGGSG